MDHIRHLQSICSVVQISAIDPEILKVVGQVAGIGGLAIGALIIIFRDIISKNIFPTLAKQQAYNLLILIVVLVWSVAIAGVVAWIFVNGNQHRNVKEFQLSGVVRDEAGNGVPGVEISVIGGTERDQTTSNGSFRLLIKREKSEAIRLRAAKKGHRSWEENVEIPNTNLIIPLEYVGIEVPPANQPSQTPTARPSTPAVKNSDTPPTPQRSASGESGGNTSSDVLNRRLQVLDNINKRPTPQL
jgi:hypothetical protein